MLFYLKYIPNCTLADIQSKEKETIYQQTWSWSENWKRKFIALLHNKTSSYVINKGCNSSMWQIIL